MNNEIVQNGLPAPSFRLWEAVCCKGCAPFRVLYEDRQVMVCQKAPGIPVQSASLRVRDLESMLKNELAGRIAEPGAFAGSGSGASEQRPFSKAGGRAPEGTRDGAPYLGIVHRLDQPVQGLLVFAKTSRSAAALSEQARQGDLIKEYLCVCRQADAAKEIPFKGTLTDALVRDGRTNLSRVAKEGAPGAKRAVLDYEVLETQNEWKLLKVTLHTGRHHQIRVQLAHFGLPIAGDQKYGDVPADDGRLRLCAYHLGFRHPETGKQMMFRLEDAER